MKILNLVIFLLSPFLMMGQDILQVPDANIKYNKASSKTDSAYVVAAYTHTVSDGTNYIPRDSGILYYNRGKSYNSNTGLYLYDTIQGYTYKVASSGFSQDLLDVQYFDAHDNVLTDIIFKRDPSSGAWIDSQKISNTYDISNNLLTTATQILNKTTTTWINSKRFVYTYDLDNNRTSDLFMLWSVDSARWDSYRYHTYTYDSHHVLLSDIYAGRKFIISSLTYELVDSSYILYNFDINGKLITAEYPVASYGPSGEFIKWSPSWRYVYLYDATNGQLTERSYQIFTGATWYEQYLSYYDYDSDENIKDENTPFHTYYAYTYDTSHNLLSQVYQTWTTVPVPHFMSVNRLRYKYNDSALVTSYTTDMWNEALAKWIPQVQNRYYYKFVSTIKPTNAVINPVATTGSVKLYPSPASTVLNIDLRWNQEQTAVLGIYDMQGRLLMQWQTENGLFSQSHIPVQQLNAGSYIINVQTKNSKISKIFTIAH